MGGGKQALQGIAAGFMSLLNPINLVTIGVVALGAVGIQALMGLGGGARSFDDALADLEASVDDVTSKQRSGRGGPRPPCAKSSALFQRWRVSFFEDMADLDRRSATRDVNAVVRGLAGKNGLRCRTLKVRPDSSARLLRSQHLEARKAGSRRAVRDAYLTSTKADGLDNQIAAR